jgi:hypothetical protein
MWAAIAELVQKLSWGPAIFDCDVLALDIVDFLQTLFGTRQRSAGLAGG